jgi:hypothetical protein
VDAEELFGRDLPALAERHASLVAAAATELAPRPLAIAVGDTRWTLAFEGERVDVRPTDAGAAAVWVLDAEGLSDLVHDVRTPMGWFTGGDLQLERGRLEDTLDWWVVLRALLDGRPVHHRGAVTFVDLDGGELDLSRSFAPDAPAEEMSHFLAEAGFLHVEGLYGTDEMAAISDDIDAAVGSYQPDDGRSWWARTADGEHRPVRLQRFQEHSPTTAGLLADERLERLGSLTGDGHRLTSKGDGRSVAGNLIEALVKPIGVVEGISDVPWHKDCSLGGHSHQCCSMTVGISVTGADASCGQLRVVAGSHRALVQPAFVRRGLDLPQVDLPTRTGDVTVHLSCTLHMSQPPVSHERRVLYTSLRLPSAGMGPAATEKLRRIREGAYRTVSQQPGHVA